MELTPQQRRAIEGAHAALAAERAGTLPPEVALAETAVFWLGHLRHALEAVADAFPTGGAS